MDIIKLVLTLPRTPPQVGVRLDGVALQVNRFKVGLVGWWWLWGGCLLKTRTSKT